MFIIILVICFECKQKFGAKNIFTKPNKLKFRHYTGFYNHTPIFAEGGGGVMSQKRWFTKKVWIKSVINFFSLIQFNVIKCKMNAKVCDYVVIEENITNPSCNTVLEIRSIDWGKMGSHSPQALRTIFNPVHKLLDRIIVAIWCIHKFWCRYDYMASPKVKVICWIYLSFLTYIPVTMILVRVDSSWQLYDSST